MHITHVLKQYARVPVANEAKFHDHRMAHTKQEE